MPAIVLFPVVALGMWRQVQFTAEPRVSLWLHRVRVGLLTLATILAAYGVYGWGWYGINVVAPLLAAWHLILELRDRSQGVSSARAAI